MRQLIATGWMHNRLRLIVASFLVKDLHLEWTRGAKHFMDHLIDGDLANNQHGWQWTAGTGTDAAPYYRVFNPTLQGKKFDPDGDYVRRWVPELKGLSAKEIHEPWKLDPPPEDYPAPIVDHDAERKEALARLPGGLTPRPEGEPHVSAEVDRPRPRRHRRGGGLGTDVRSRWYDRLDKPAWQPPGWAFGPGMDHALHPHRRRRRPARIDRIEDDDERRAYIAALGDQPRPQHRLDVGLLHRQAAAVGAGRDPRAQRLEPRPRPAQRRGRPRRGLAARPVCGVDRRSRPRSTPRSRPATRRPDGTAV